MIQGVHLRRILQATSLAIALLFPYGLPQSEPKQLAPFAPKPIASPEAIERGRKIFRGVGFCYACHGFEEGKHRAGASHYNMFGEVAGRIKGFHFSDALKDSNLLWDQETTDRFLISPKAMVPGISPMMYQVAIPDPQDRRDLIAYLRVAAERKPVFTETQLDFDRPVSFQAEVSPILYGYCGKCHGNETELSSPKLKGVLLDNWDEVMLSGTNGPIVVPGDPDKSRLMDFLYGPTHFTTPQPHEVNAIRRWIAEGAKDDAGFLAGLRLSLPNVSDAENKTLSCYAATDSFLLATARDAETGSVLFSDWETVGARSWASWKVTGTGGRAVTLELRIFPKERREWTSPCALFVLGKEYVGSMIEDYTRVEANPIKLGSGATASINYYLDWDSDVDINIYSNDNLKPAKSLFQKTLPDIQPASNKFSWDLKTTSGAPLVAGKYVARIDIRPKMSRDLAYTVATLFEAR